MKKWVIAAVVIAIAIAGYFVLGSGSGEGQKGQALREKRFAIQVVNRKVIGNDTTFIVNTGDTVSLTISADESDELHLHGYDKSVDFSTNTPATLTFTADKSGRFPFEMEGSKTDLGEIDVLP